MNATSRKTLLLNELVAHLPFSIFFTAAGMAVAGLLLYVAIVSSPASTPEHHHERRQEEADTALSETGGNAHNKPHEAAHQHRPIPINPHMNIASCTLFHLFHPIHLLFSAIATTAMFSRHESRLLKAIIVGFIGSAGVCGLSDVFLPYLSGKLLGLEGMRFHWCLIEHPQMVLPFIGIGILCGVLAPRVIGRSTEFSHSGHIFVSVIASLFYLISFGVENWVDENVFPYVFIIVLLCVTIPCCISDIIFPLLSVSCHPSSRDARP